MIHTSDANVVVRDLHFLRGPSLYAYKPILIATIDIGPYDTLPSTAFPGFVDHLTTWLPGLYDHECSRGHPGGFVERLREGTYLPHITEHVTIELQNIMGYQVSFGRSRNNGEDRVYTVMVAYKDEEPARAAFNTALRLVLAAMHDLPFDPETEIQALTDLAATYRLGPSSAAIVAAARARNIPVMRLTPTASLVQLGWGVYQKRIQAAETTNTSAIAVDMCQDKALTNRMLRAIGVLVPDGRTVASADEAWAAATSIGLPVVVKPADGNQGNGVSVNLSDEDSVRSAYEIASEYSDQVLVEQYIEGDDYRLLVVGGKMVAAARREPAHVVGDGRHTIEELVVDVNRDPRRGKGHSKELSQMRIDDNALRVLRQQGLAPWSVPKLKEVVRLRRNCNLSTGGTATDVTDEVDYRNVRLAELAAQIMGLDIAGIDIVCKDITRPLNEQRGAVVEVNAAPGLRMHLYPTAGRRREVGEPIVDMLFPNGSPSRIPVIAVTGTNGKTTVTRLIAHIFETAHKTVGMTCTEGIYIGKERIVTGDCSGPNSARTVLLHPYVEVAVLETARGGILREGLAFDECKVGIVTNVSADHLGLKGVHTVEELAAIKQVIIESVSDSGAAVLNADDPLVAEMSAVSSGRVVFFSRRPENRVVSAHLESRGDAVLVENNKLILASGLERTELMELERIPLTIGGRIPFQIENVLAATAAAWSLGLNPAVISRALATFEGDTSTVPARFNIMEHNGIELIVDYGHNAAAMKAVGQAIAGLEPRKTWIVFCLPGDRRDEDLAATIDAMTMFAGGFVVYDPADRRGRDVGSVYRIARARIAPGIPCLYAPTERAALLLALKRVRRGARLVYVVDETDEGLDLLNSLPTEHISKAASDAKMPMYTPPKYEAHTDSATY